MVTTPMLMLQYLCLPTFDSYIFFCVKQVVVLTSDNTVLYDRLIKRGYNNAKVQENIQCEIMRVC